MNRQLQGIIKERFGKKHGVTWRYGYTVGGGREEGEREGGREVRQQLELVVEGITDLSS